MILLWKTVVSISYFGGNNGRQKAHVLWLMLLEMQQNLLFQMRLNLVLRCL